MGLWEVTEINRRQQEYLRATQEEIEKFNHPYKRDTIIYFNDIYKVGGIQTWIVNLAQEYEFSVLYDTGDRKRIRYLESLGIECIRYVGQPIECDKFIRCMWGNPKNENITAKEVILVVHGDYSVLIFDPKDVPIHDRVICVSKDSAIGWKKYAGEEAEVIYNPVTIFKETKPLIIGCFSRLSKEKGKERYKKLIQGLKDSGKPFLMFFFTDFPFEDTDPRVMFFEPILNPTGWMGICDYVALLSDTEACPYNVLEALKMGKPMIITRLNILEEMGVNETNAKILDFDMSNLDIDDLWNIPVVKNWKEPNCKGWEKYMKKKVLRERRITEEEVQAVAKAIKTHAIEEDKEVEEVVDEIIEEAKEEKKSKKKVK